MGRLIVPTRMEGPKAQGTLEEHVVRRTYLEVTQTKIKRAIWEIPSKITLATSRSILSVWAWSFPSRFFWTCRSNTSEANKHYFHMKWLRSASKNRGMEWGSDLIHFLGDWIVQLLLCVHVRCHACTNLKTICYVYPDHMILFPWRNSDIKCPLRTWSLTKKI